jgi:AAA domain
MISQSGRRQLASLTDEELISLIRALPGLATSWAKVTGTDAQWLGQGRQRALGALRMAMTRRNDQLLDSLTRVGLDHLAATVGIGEMPDESANRPAELAVAAELTAAELAAAAGKEFGAVAGCIFLSGIAASGLPATAEVAARLAELHEVAIDSSSARDEPGLASIPEPVQPLAEAAAASESTGVLALLEQTQALRQAGSELADVLRAAAADVGSGKPVTAIADDLRAWSAAVTEQLSKAADVSPAADLATLSQGLADILNKARQEDQQRRDLLHCARLFGADGLGHLVPGLLHGAGYGSLDELQAIVDATDADGAQTAQLPDGGQASPARAADVQTLASEPSEPPSDVLSLPAAEAELVPPAPAIPEPAAPAPAIPEPAAPAPAIPEPAVSQPEAEPGARTHDTPEFAGRTPPADDDETINFPWDAGTPPLLASLISEGREALAVCVAEAAGESEFRQRLLKFFCVAYACAPAALELQLPELTPTDAEFEQLGADECRVLVAVALRAGLALGYSPVALPALLEHAELGHESSRAIVDAATEAVRRGYRHKAGAAIQKHADLPRRWTAFADEAAQLREWLTKRKLNLQRASNVLHHLARLDQPVGRALGMVTELAGQGASPAASAAENAKWSHIEQLASDLANPAKRARILEQADRAVSTRPQLRKAIIGSPKARLDESLQDVAALLARFIAVRSAIRLSSRAADQAAANELFRAVELRPASTGVRSVGDAALQRLVDWLRADTCAEGAASIDDLLRATLEPLYEIPRVRSGNPARLPELAEVRELLHGRHPAVVVRGYLRAGNVTAARSIVAVAGLTSPALDDELLRGTRHAEDRHSAALAAVDRTAARLRAVYEDEAARDLTLRAEQLRVPPDGRFDFTTDRLCGLADEGSARLRAFCDDLRRRTDSASCGAAEKQRIHDLIDREDEILAVEFLTIADAGHPLPAAEEQHGDDFSEFFPAMVNAAAAATAVRGDVINAVRVAAGGAGRPANRQLAAGLAAWRELRANRRAVGDNRFRLQVAEVLRMLGLVPPAQNWLQEISRTQRSGYATFKVRASPLDRSYVPSLGTQAHGNYDLTIVWDSVTPTRLMDFIEERRRTEANIILYFGVLDQVQRMMLRRLTSHGGGKGFSPLVVDAPVVGWLSTRPEPGWRFTQRVTLPFTTFNPYTPFAGGEVPDEVFVGRESERQAIESPTGSMFVYGGRQLGKSALLRRVERLFTEPPSAEAAGARVPRSGHVAVYIDLKAASIGEAQEPAALWTVLAQRLRDAGVFPAETARRAGRPDDVTNQLSQWLSTDHANRLLLLLDEADNFLTADFQTGQAGRGPVFPTLQRLKDLMERSERRFKPVFAGLHQVQRFHDTSNTPVAHGGDDILIGPLRSLDAYRLAVDPMNALGYKFSSPELVWRLLLLTNYQASLVQIMCEALVREMQGRQLPEGGGRIEITSSDIESVYAKKEVKDLIAQRFRWTINLDNRYRVIALVVAFRSLDADPGEVFSAEELHSECDGVWPVGFSRGVLSSKEFRRYLDEMVGLGVLHAKEGQYGLRSPNIIGLLGNREYLYQELSEAKRFLELQYEYNPTMNRRILGQSTELWAPRSPLADHDIAALLGLGGGPARPLHIVTGSAALTVDRVAQVIEDVARERRIPCQAIRPADVDTAVIGGRPRRHIIVDASSADGAALDLAALCKKLRARGHGTATVVVGPAALPLPADVADPGDVLVTRRWSIEGLRSWHESPFHTPELRALLHRVTSGWPRLVEETMREIANGKSPEDALKWIAGQLLDPSFAREHLRSSGIDPDIAAKWATWQAQDGPDGLIEALPATLSDLTEALETDAREVIERLEILDLVESADGDWVLDRTIVAAALAQQE